MSGKKIFLIWADGQPEIIKMISNLEKKGHKVVYWVGNGNPDLSRIQHIIYHDHYAAWAGTPAEGIDPSDFPPPGKDLIDSFHKTESIIMSMMNKKFDTLCVDERRHIYYKMLRYWHGVIKKFSPDVIIFPSIPHTVYNYLISELALYLGIKTIMFEDTWVANRIITYSDWRLGSDVLQNVICKNDGKNFSMEDLSKDMQEYYRLVYQPKSHYIPEYMTFYNRQFNGLNRLKKKLSTLIRSIRQGNVFYRLPNYILKQFRMNLEKEYKNIESLPDFSKKFVYVPLGFQPERTTSPQGDVFVDQILMIETLAQSLPKDWIIYVKEHPGQWMLRVGVNYSSSRYAGYYKRCVQVKNVKIVPINISSHELISRSGAVALATGTAGFEAISKYKPVVIFGYPWYRDFPKLFRAHNTETCRAALSAIVEGFSFGKQDVINYLKSFEEGTIHGFLETVPGRKLNISLEASVRNITDYILKEI